MRGCGGVAGRVPPGQEARAGMAWAGVAMPRAREEVEEPEACPHLSSLLWSDCWAELRLSHPAAYLPLLLGGAGSPPTPHLAELPQLWTPAAHLPPARGRPGLGSLTVLC